MYLNKMNPFFATLLVGSSFWGAAFSGAATGSFFGSIVYLLLWDESKPFAVAALAVIVGQSDDVSFHGRLGSPISEFTAFLFK